MNQAEISGTAQGTRIAAAFYSDASHSPMQMRVLVLATVVIVADGFQIRSVTAQALRPLTQSAPIRATSPVAIFNFGGSATVDKLKQKGKKRVGAKSNIKKAPKSSKKVKSTVACHAGNTQKEPRGEPKTRADARR